MCLHGEMILKGIEIHFIFIFFPIQQFIAENLIKVHAESSVYSVPCLFYKASMQMELFSIQKIVIINSVHDREFELRNTNTYAQKNLFRKHNGLKDFLRKHSFFVCLFIWSPSKKEYD